MADLENVATYFASVYEWESLSVPILEKLTYLAEWGSWFQEDETITCVDWYRVSRGDAGVGVSDRDVAVFEEVVSLFKKGKIKPVGELELSVEELNLVGQVNDRFGKMDGYDVLCQTVYSIPPSRGPEEVGEKIDF